MKVDFFILILNLILLQRFPDSSKHLGKRVAFEDGFVNAEVHNRILLAV
jgi:hypothetical protein